MKLSLLPLIKDVLAISTNSISENIFYGIYCVYELSEVVKKKSHP